MSEFKISKSTALRYITALEDIGVPLMGRYGRYKVLEVYGIPPITFTPQETYALFFSIKSMELLEPIPFQAEYSTIFACAGTHKLLFSLSISIKIAPSHSPTVFYCSVLLKSFSFDVLATCSQSLIKMS